MRRSLKLVLFVSVGTLLFAGAAQALTATGVITGRSDVWYPAYGVDPDSGDQYISFTQYTRTGHANAWYRKNGGTKVQLNHRGWGWSWGLDPTTKTIAYQTSTSNGNADVKLFDWSTGTRRSAGTVVNMPNRWEYEPSLSGTSLLFARLNEAARPDRRRLYLYDTKTEALTLLDQFTGGNRAGTLWVGQVNGDWAVWEKDTDSYKNDTVYRYQISTGQTETIPHASTRLDYAASVTTDGTMYFIRSKHACGAAVRLRSLDTTDTLTTLYDLPAGRDVAKTFAVLNADGSTSVYFDSFRCADKTGNGNIYKVTIPADGGAVTATVAPGGQAEPDVRSGKRHAGRQAG